MIIHYIASGIYSIGCTTLADMKICTQNYQTTQYHTHCYTMPQYIQPYSVHNHVKILCHIILLYILSYDIHVVGQTNCIQNSIFVITMTCPRILIHPYMLLAVYLSLFKMCDFKILINGLKIKAKNNIIMNGYCLSLELLTIGHMFGTTAVQSHSTYCFVCN